MWPNLRQPVLRDVLVDILDTPVSPELLPPENGAIAQQTEKLSGRMSCTTSICIMCCALGFSREDLPAGLPLLTAGMSRRYCWRGCAFYRRFFAQQFKRSCLPDGPKVGSVTLVPRGDWRMPAMPAIRCGWQN